jgi:hypothetical protein
MKHVILRTTNGSGYSDHPLLVVTEDFKSAESLFNENVGQLCRDHFDAFEQESILTSINKENHKVFNLEFADNEAVHWLQNVQPRTLITINADFSNEISIETDVDSPVASVINTSNIEGSHECDSFSEEDEETGTVYHHIYVK